MPDPAPSRNLRTSGPLLTMQEARHYCGVSEKTFRSRILPGLSFVDLSGPTASRRIRRFRREELDSRLIAMQRRGAA